MDGIIINNETNIGFFWNGSIVGTNHHMVLDNEYIPLCGIISTDIEAKIEAISILKDIYNIDYQIENIKFEWGGQL